MKDADHDDAAKRYLRDCLEDDDKASIPCRWFVDRAYLCMTPGNQVTHYYRYGRVDECKGTFKNVFRCFRASLMSEEKRMEYLKNTPIDPTTPPRRANVWEEKETPGW